MIPHTYTVTLISPSGRKITRELSGFTCDEAMALAQIPDDWKLTDWKYSANQPSSDPAIERAEQQYQSAISKVVRLTEVLIKTVQDSGNNFSCAYEVSKQKSE